jgi:alkylresorcinol/alkylpyrone synthase
MAPSAQLLSIATAVPRHVLGQQEVAAAVAKAFEGRIRDFDRLAPVFHTAGIRQRYGVRPISWYLEPRGWPERTEAYLDGAGELFEAAARAALDQAGLRPEQVDVVVTISSTGIATPSLEARLKGRLGFRDDVRRLPLFGLGCAGGVTGLGLGARLAQESPGLIVLVVSVEVCSLSFRLDSLTKANIVATALFCDGASACVLCTKGRGLAQVEGSGEHTWPDTLDIMGWSVDPVGFGVILDRAVPPFAEERIGPAVRAILHRQGLAPESVDRFVCHPGGVKVVAALERGLGLPDGSLDIERDILAEYGNMSAPTALFVLERAIQRGLPARAVLTAMGPGFTASCVTLRAL